MLPFWKIKRELSRLTQQLHGLYEIATHPIRQPWLEKKADKALRFSEGQWFLSDSSPIKIAIFLVFQPNGLGKSVSLTCKHLSNNGYAVLLIANHPISDSDKVHLSSTVWRFAERQNYGYDFGGYKEGVKLLWKWGINPDFLIILNDSIWFPLDENCCLINKMELSNGSFIGAKRHTLAGVSDEEFGGFFESYFFLIKQSVWSSLAFIKYWQNYISTSNKYLTVRRGERGFSSAMFKAKFSSEGIYSRDRFLTLMSKQTPEILRKTLVYGAYTEIEFDIRSKILLKEFRTTNEWAEQALELIKDVVNRRNFASSFCYPCCSLLNISFMKKNKGQLQLIMRKQYIRAVEAGDLPKPDSATFQEILNSI